MVSILVETQAVIESGSDEIRESGIGTETETETGDMDGGAVDQGTKVVTIDDFNPEVELASVWESDCILGSPSRICGTATLVNNREQILVVLSFKVPSSGYLSIERR